MLAAKGLRHRLGAGVGREDPQSAPRVKTTLAQEFCFEGYCLYLVCQEKRAEMARDC